MFVKLTDMMQTFSKQQLRKEARSQNLLCICRLARLMYSFDNMDSYVIDGTVARELWLRFHETKACQHFVYKTQVNA